MLNQSINKQTMSKIVTLLLLTLVSIVVNAQQQLNTAVQVVVDTNNASAATQTRIDSLNDQTDELTAKYRNVLNEIESLREYNKQLEAVVNDQRAQIVSIEQQMTSLEQTNRGVVPMIIEMIDSLGQLVEADIPFLKEERLDRVAELEGMIGSQAYTTSELYRKVTEAYGIELDYGSTVESYQDALPNGKEVDFLRVGRTTLIYQTLNQEVSGWWNSSTGQFEELDKRYNAEIKEAIRIAKKQASPDLTGLPVFAADNAGGQ
jgi:TolA-binding protein